MSLKKGRETPLQLCGRTTLLSNSISARLLEYLSTVKHEPHNFRRLAGDFLDVSRILWSIEAWLTEISRSPGGIPAEMTDELDRKIQQVHDDFTILNQTLAKFLETERKGGILKGWRLMSVDSSIDKMRVTMKNNREALRISALVFRWSLGESKTDVSMGMGCTALAAALGRIEPASVPAAPAPPPKIASSLLRSVSAEPPELPLLLPPTFSAAALSMSASETDIATEEMGHTLPGSPDRRSFRSASTRKANRMTKSSLGALKPTSTVTEIVIPDDMSEDTMALASMEDLMSETESAPRQTAAREVRISNEEQRARVVSVLGPRSTSRQMNTANSAAIKMAMKNAIQQHKHEAVEQLLNYGVLPDAKNLRSALLEQDIESVRLLLLFGANSNGADETGTTPLFSATDLSFFAAAKLLAEYGADPNLPSGSAGESPFALAVVENKIDFVRLFLAYGGDGNSIMANGDTVLVKAMNKMTQKRIVELMLDSRANPNGKNREGVSPLFAAVQAGRVDLVTLLLDRGADVNLPGPKHVLWPAISQPGALQHLLSRGADHKKCSGLMELATSMNNKESITVLLAAGVDPNSKKDGTYTPLCSAIRDNRSDLVALLLANGADPNLEASEFPAFKCVTHKRTHLLTQLIVAGSDLHNPKGIAEKAVAFNNKEALLYLLEHGVNPDDRSPEGQTALTTAIRENMNDYVDILLKYGANPSIRGQDWPISMAVNRPEILSKLLAHNAEPRNLPKGVMEQAVAANEIESVKLLLQAGVSVEDKTGGVFSPLTTAIRDRRKDIVQFLLDEAGADPNAPGEHLPIIKAIRRCPGTDYSIIQILLDRGANINLMYRGWNAVLQAVEYGDPGILKLLVERGGGVDLEVEDESGMKVMDVVKGRGWQEAVDILRLDEREAETTK